MRRVLVLCLAALPLESGEREDIAAFVRLFCDGPPAARATAASRLRRYGRRAWQPLAPCLDHTDPDIRRRARHLWNDLVQDWWGKPAPGTGFDRKTGLPRRVIDHKTGIEFALIPAGTFVMGSNHGPVWERPAHEVTIAAPFYMGCCEVTVGQFQKGLPDGFYFAGLPQSLEPMRGFSWKAIQRFFKATGMRLPTETEWECACARDFDPAKLDEIAWHLGNSGDKVKRGGLKSPNAFGLYDMLGNVAELCSNRFLPYKGAHWFTTVKGRAVRGGSGAHPATACRPSYRASVPERDRSDWVGFRVVRDS